MTIDEMRVIAQPQKKVSNSWFNSIISRKVSIYITWIFLKLNLSANAATFFHFTLGFIGPILIIYQNFYLNSLGSMFLIFFFIIDNVDGELARLYNCASLRGKFIDYIGHYINNNTPIIAFGLHLYLITNLERYLFLSIFIYIVKNGIFGIHMTWKYLLVEFPRLLNKANKQSTDHSSRYSYIKRTFHIIHSNQLLAIVIGLSLLLSYFFGPIILKIVMVFYTLSTPLYFLLIFFYKYQIPELNVADPENYE